MTYPSTIAKVALGVIGVSTATVTGFGIHSALQDKTIGDAIIRKGKTLINNKDVFEIAFKQHKKEPAFLTLISTEGNNIQASDSLEKGGLALNNWCTEKLKLPLTEENTKAYLDNSTKYCSLPWMTMREKLKALGKELAKNWDARLAKIDTQKDQELKTTLATNNPSMSSPSINRNEHKQIWINALKHWCEEKSNIPLVWDKDDKTFEKMDSYCFEKNQEQ